MAGKMDEEKLKIALRNAHNAGDTEAATMLANEIKRLRQSKSTVEPESLADDAASGLGYLKGAAGVLGEGMVGAAQEAAAGLSGLSTAYGNVVLDVVNSLGIRTPERVNAADAVKKIQDAEPLFTADSPEAMEIKQAAGELLAPLGEGLMAARQGLGDTAFELTGSPAVAAMAYTLPDFALEAAGAATGIKVKRLAQRAANKELATKILDVEKTRLDPKARVIESPPMEAAKYVLDGAVGVTKNKAFSPLIAQGFDPTTAALVAGSKPADLSSFYSMVKSAQRQSKSRRAKITDRYAAVAGKSLIDRAKTLESLRKRTGQEVKTASESLKGQTVNVDQSLINLIESLEKKRVTVDENFNPNFSDSRYSGNKFSQDREAITQVLSRVKKIKSRGDDAYGAHDLKSIIDDYVDFDPRTNKASVSSGVENDLKSLRSDINSALTNVSPEYRKANQKYSEIINNLDEIKSVAGRNINLLDDANSLGAGQTLRTLTANNKTSGRMVNAIEQSEKVLRDNGIIPKTDPFSQALFANDLDRILKPEAETGLGALVREGSQLGKEAMRGETSALGSVSRGVSAAKNKVFGVTPDKGLKTMEDFIKEYLKKGKK